MWWAQSNPDIFNANVIFTNTGTSFMSMARTAAGNQFNGNIELNAAATAGGIWFGANGGTSTQATATTLVIGGTGFDAAELGFINFTKLGTGVVSLTASTGTLTSVSGCVWNGNISFTSGRFTTSTTTYQGVTYIHKTGASNDNSNGGNTFNDNVELVVTGSGRLEFSRNAADIFNENIVVNSTNGGIWFGQNGGSTTLASGKTISVGATGFSAGDLRLRAFTQLGTTPQTLVLTGSSAIYLEAGSEWNGNISFTAPRFLTRQTTYNGTVYLEKTGALGDESYGGNTFNSTTTIVTSGHYIWFGVTAPDLFNGDAIFTNTGTSTLRVARNAAGNQFNGNIELNSSSTATGIYFGTSGGTVTQAAGTTITIGAGGFNAANLVFTNFTKLGADAVTLVVSSSTNTAVSNCVWNGNVSFTSGRFTTETTTYNGTAYVRKIGGSDDNSDGGNTFNEDVELVVTGSGRLEFSRNTADLFNGNIVVNSTNGGIRFGQNGGSTTLASGKTITVGATGFSAGDLRLMNFTQVGATPQAMILTGTAAMYLQTGSIWNGTVNFTAPDMYLNGSTFNATTQLTKVGNSNHNDSNGGNTFNAVTTIRNTNTNARRMRLANTTADTFNSDVTFENSGTGDLQPAYNNANIFQGNIHVDGTILLTFASGNGTVVCTGTTAQSISKAGASPTPVFRRLQTNKASGNLTLNTTIEVSVLLTLTSGNVVSNASNLLVMTNGSAVGAMSDAAYVAGPVRKVGNSAFTFPIGKNGFLRPATISAPSNTAHHFTAEYFFTDPPADGYPAYASLLENPIQRISSCEYWMINRTNGASNVTVTLSYRTVGANGCSGVIDPAELVVARWDGAMWRNHGNGGTIGVADDGTVVTAAAVTSFSPFTLATLDLVNPLPIELVHFSATPKDKVVEVNWTTLTEINNDYFVVERSADGNAFQVLGTTPGAGNSSQMLQYSWTDYSPLKGTSYYRLKQVDFDGSYSYSNTVAVSRDAFGDLVIFPNPAREQVTIQRKNTETVRVVLLAVDGTVVRDFLMQDESTVIEVNALPAGTYLLKFITEGNSQVEKLVVK